VLPGQLSSFKRTSALVQEFLHQMGISAFERKNVRLSTLLSELALTCEDKVVDL
jgi:hypothetical protein